MPASTTGVARLHCCVPAQPCQTVHDRACTHTHAPLHTYIVIIIWFSDIAQCVPIYGDNSILLHMILVANLVYIYT